MYLRFHVRKVSTKRHFTLWGGIELYPEFSLQIAFLGHNNYSHLEPERILVDTRNTVFEKKQNSSNNPRVGLCLWANGLRN